MRPDVVRTRALRIELARLHQRVGWASLVGVGLAVSAAVLACVAWRDYRASVETLARMASAPVDTRDERAHAQAAKRPASAIATLPAMSDMPALLKQLEAIAIANGLGLGRGRLPPSPASDTEPASIEIRTQLTGPYPRLRRMASQALGHVPALTIRQLSFTRATSDTADVEAKIVFAILLADGLPADGAPASHSGAP